MAKRLQLKGGFGSGGVSSWNDLTDKPFYVEEGSGVSETLLEETTWGLEPLHAGIYAASDSQGCGISLEPDMTYIITIDGLAHTVSGANLTVNGESLTYIGNIYLLVTVGMTVDSSYNTGEDWVFYYIGEPINFSSAIDMFLTSTAAETVTVSLATGASSTIHCLDEKFIPDTVARMSDIPEAVIPDLSQNDSTQPDYVKNRTHWAEIDITQLHNFSADVKLESTNGYKSEDVNVLAPNVEAGRFYTVMVDGVDYVLECQECTILVNATECTNLMIGNIGLYPPRENLPNNLYPDLPFLVQFYYTSNGWFRSMWCSSPATLAVQISDDCSVYHQLDEKYIPDSVARKTDITWENLPDKPFGESQTTIEWDGNTEGLDSASITWEPHILYKVSEATPSIDEIVGATCVMGAVGDNSSDMSMELDQDAVSYMFEEATNGLVGDQIIVAYDTTIIRVSGEEITVPSPGTYTGIMDGKTIKSITYGSTKTIDEKFIPDSIARTWDIPDGLPAVTTDNNGAFLRVVDGVWTTATVANAEEASF